MNKIEGFKATTHEMEELYERKNHDYGDSFEQSCDKFGLIASIVRISDKMNRLEALTINESKVKDESIIDTLIDMASYSVMTIMWLRSRKGI